MLFHCFVLTSSSTPEQCCTALKMAAAANTRSDEPRSHMWGRLFRLSQSEYFDNSRSRIIYTIYGRIREAENGRAQITCYQFQSSADPLKFLLLILVVMLGFSIGPIKNTVRDLVPHLKIALKIAVFFVIGDWLRCFVSRKMYGEDLPCSLDEFLCEIMNARLKGR